MTGECQTSRLLSTGQTTGAEEVLTRRLLHRCMDCDASCIEEVFSLFDGQAELSRTWDGTDEGLADLKEGERASRTWRALRVW